VNDAHSAEAVAFLEKKKH